MKAYRDEAYGMVADVYVPGLPDLCVVAQFHGGPLADRYIDLDEQTLAELAERCAALLQAALVEPAEET